MTEARDPLADLFPDYSDADWERLTRQHIPRVVPGQQDDGSRFLPGQGRTQPPPGGIEDSAVPPSDAPSPAAPGDDGSTEPPAEEVPPVEPGQTTPPPGSEPGQAPGAPDVEPPDNQPEVTPTGEGFVEVGGQRIPISQVEAYLQFDQLIQNNPAVAQAIVQALNPPPAGDVRGGPSQEPVSGRGEESGLTPPPDLDLDDPAVKFLWDQLQSTRQQITNLQQGMQETAGLTQAQLRAQQDALVNRASQMFQERMHLEDKDLKRVSDVAARMNVLPALLQPFDPVTGAPRQVDPIAAVDKALELAYYAIPEYRQAEYARERQNYIKEQQRKQKAGALAGSSGSVPRTRPEPRNDSERRAAMIADVAEMMNGTFTGE